MNTNKKAGFTLIELIVVGLILSIITTIAIVIFWVAAFFLANKAINKIPEQQPAVEQPVDQGQE